MSHTSPPPLPPIAAVVLLLPAHARPTWYEPLLAHRAGFFQSLFRLAGLRGVYRMCVTYEWSVQRMIEAGLRGLDIAEGKEE